MNILEQLKLEQKFYEESEPPKSNRVGEIIDYIEKLNDIIYELEQNLEAAEDQNHYLKLARDFKGEYYAAKYESKQLKKCLANLVEDIEVGHLMGNKEVNPNWSSMNKARELLKD